jgi:hypothetical protein
MRKLHLLALAALIMLGLSGCEKAKVANDASADVFVKSIINPQGATVYTAVYSVFSYNQMTSVSVLSTAGSTAVQLKNYENGGNSFFNEPVDADYSATAPATGIYTFNVKFSDGEEKTFTNSLSSATLLPANITSVAKTALGDSVIISWNPIANTHAYQLKVTKGTTDVFYQRPFMYEKPALIANPRYAIPINVFSSAGTGSFNFELTGILFESTTSYDYYQAISSSTKTVDL